MTHDNYFLFTPMLHEVAASHFEMNTIINPLGKTLRRVKTFTGNIETINLERRCVAVTHGFDHHAHELSYNHLMFALGSSTNFFGLPGLQDAALTTKTLDDAIELRKRIIKDLEEASSECAAGQRQPLFTFVVVGAGFAGVECAARNVAADIVGGSKRSFRFSNVRPARGNRPPNRGGESLRPQLLGVFCMVLWRTIYLFKLHGSRRRCALLSIGRSISVLQRISHV